MDLIYEQDAGFTSYRVDVNGRLGVGVDPATLKPPSDVQRGVAFADQARDLRGLIGMDGAVPETERRYPGKYWNDRVDVSHTLSNGGDFKQSYDLKLSNIMVAMIWWYCETNFVIVVLSSYLLRKLLEHFSFCFLKSYLSNENCNPSLK